jgi:hypothetical protein
MRALQGAEMDHQLAAVALRQAQEAKAASQEEHKRALATMEETQSILRDKLGRSSTQCASLTSKMAEMYSAEHVQNIQREVIKTFQVNHIMPGTQAACSGTSDRYCIEHMDPALDALITISVHPLQLAT